MSAPREPRALPPWWAVLLVALALVGLAFSIGRFSTFGAGTATPATPTTDSADAGFARDMQLHHGQAVEMAMIAYRSTENDDIRVLAYDIATTQSAQRGEFYDWLVKWNLPQQGGQLMSWMMDAGAGHDHAATAPTGADATTTEELMARMGMAGADELARLRASTGTPADCLFLELMIRHHEGAIPMAEALLDLGGDARARQVAQGIIDTQSAEIDLMTSLRRGLSCS